jgi:hypothetical protein
MRGHRRHQQASGRRGSALVTVTFAAAVLATLSFSLLAVTLSNAREQQGSKEKMRARYVCEAALSDAILDLKAGGSGDCGNANDPVDYGSGSYWVEASVLTADLTQLVATGREDRSGARLELTVQRTTSNLFQWGAFGDEQLAMDSNARTDSYDSTKGSYASQVVNGSGSSAYANANGSVGSNQDVTLKQNSKVYGDALPGPGGSTAVLGNAEVSGGTAPQPAVMEMPEIQVPIMPSKGSLSVPGATPLTLAPGDHRFDQFEVQTGGIVAVTGPARLVFEDFLLSSNAEFLVDASAGPVEVYIEGDFILESNTLMASKTYTPADLRVNLLSDNVKDPSIQVQLDIVTFDSNAQLYGTIYAPKTVIDIDSNFELFGSLIARRVTLDSNARVHYDESLATSSSLTESSYRTVCWRILPFRP